MARSSEKKNPFYEGVHTYAINSINNRTSFEEFLSVLWMWIFFYYLKTSIVILDTFRQSTASVDVLFVWTSLFVSRWQSEISLKFTLLCDFRMYFMCSNTKRKKNEHRNKIKCWIEHLPVLEKAQKWTKWIELSREKKTVNDLIWCCWNRTWNVEGS